MAINFPDNPQDGTTHTHTDGKTWTYNDGSWSSSGSGGGGGVQSYITDGTKTVSFNNSNEVIMDTDLNVDAINISGHVLPSLNAQFDLGNAEYKIRHLFLSDNSLRFGKDGTGDVSGQYVSFGKDNLDRNAEVYTDADGVTPPNLQSAGKKGDIRIIGDQMYVCIQTAEEDNVSTNWYNATSSSGGGSSLWTQSGSDIYYNTGNIGIETTTPLDKLEVSGGVRVSESWSGTPSSSGVLDYLNTGSSKITRLTSQGTDSSRGQFKFLVQNNVGSDILEALNINSSGDVGLGVNNIINTVDTSTPPTLDGTDATIPNAPITNFNYLQQEFSRSMSISGDGNVLAVSAARAVGITDGCVHIYRKDVNDDWVLSQTLSNPDESGSEDFGISVSLSSDGNLMAVGVKWLGLIEDGSSGTQYSGSVQPYSYYRSGVYIYEYVNSSWSIRDTILDPKTTPSHEFGKSVALSADGSILIVGTPHNDTSDAFSEGAVYRFHYDQGGLSWNQADFLTISYAGTYPASKFGSSVSISDDGSILVVGAIGHDTSSTNNDTGGNEGRVYTYIWDVSNFTYISRGSSLEESPAGLNFGRALALNSDGNTLVVSSKEEKTQSSSPRVGSVHIYDWAGSWVKRNFIMKVPNPIGNPSFQTSHDNFGLSVTVTNTIAGGKLFIGNSDRYITTSTITSPSTYYEGGIFSYASVEVPSTVFEKLEIGGAIKISSTSNSPSASDAGIIQWSGSDFLGYTGSEWASLTYSSDNTLELLKTSEANTGEILSWNGNDFLWTPEQNNLTANVTWTDVPDEYITESSVTQHEDKLDIAINQISDLGNYVSTISGTANEIEVSGTASSGAGFTIGLPNDVTIANNLTVTGNLSINGNSTRIDSTVTTIIDPVISIGGKNTTTDGFADLTTSDTKDRGIEFKYWNASSKLGFMGWDSSEGKFTLLKDAASTGETFSGTKAELDAQIDWSNIIGKPTTATSDTDTTYSIKASSLAGSAGVSLDLDASGSGSGTDIVNFKHSGATTVTWTDAETITISSTDTTYSTATSSDAGLVKIGYTETGKNYPVELDNGKMFVNVPWTDTDTTYSTADSSNLGLVKIGYTLDAAGKNYPVELNSGKMFVNVPWTDTNTDTTYSTADSSNLGLVKIGYTLDAAGKKYPVELDSSDKMFVNVPWTDSGGSSLWTENSTNISPSTYTDVLIDDNLICKQDIKSASFSDVFTVYGYTGSAITSMPSSSGIVYGIWDVAAHNGSRTYTSNKHIRLNTSYMMTEIRFINLNMNSHETTTFTVTCNNGAGVAPTTITDITISTNSTVNTTKTPIKWKDGIAPTGTQGAYDVWIFKIMRYWSSYTIMGEKIEYS